MDENYFFNLIAAVRDEPGIYVKNHPMYIDKEERGLAWERIAVKLDKPRIDCEKRWKLLREKYGRMLKSGVTTTGSGENEETWPYLEAMSFIKDHLKKRNRTNRSKQNISNVSTQDDSPHNASVGPPFKIIKIEEHREVVVGFRNALNTIANKLESQSNDEDDIFLKNVTIMLKPFPTKQKDLLKAKIFNLITEERQNLF